MRLGYIHGNPCRRSAPPKTWLHFSVHVHAGAQRDIFSIAVDGGFDVLVFSTFGLPWLHVGKNFRSGNDSDGELGRGEQ